MHGGRLNKMESKDRPVSLAKNKTLNLKIGNREKNVYICFFLFGFNGFVLGSFQTVYTWNIAEFLMSH